VASIGSAVFTTGGGTTTITGTCVASSSFSAVVLSSTSAVNTLTGPFINNLNGMMAVYSAKMFLTNTPTYWAITDSGGNNRYLYTSDFAPDYPVQTDVRLGATYNAGLMTGTMNVPAPGVVTAGVPVDNTIGTALFDAASIISAVWDTQANTLTTSGSIGARAKNTLTADALGNLLSNL